MQNQTQVEGKSNWTGSVLGLLGTSLACFFIISLTLGIATPWAVAYAINYYVEHMRINGQRLKFTGKGGQIFGKWILWMLLTIVTLGIYSFWIPNNMCKWVTSHIEID